MNNTAMDYTRRFSGIRRLYGEAALQCFADSHVCVIGVGGVGSWAAEALARSAIGEITLIDLDNVSESNVNRQIHALNDEFGRPKVEVMRQRILAINPACRVNAVEDFAADDNLDRLLNTSHDYVLDCIDSYRTKAHLIVHCRRNRIPVITVGGAGGQVDPLKIRVADLSRTEQDPLLSKIRKLLRKDYGFTRNLKRRFDVPCVYSSEQLCIPDAEIAMCREPEDDAGVTGLNCAGYGSCMMVTASFGLVAVSHVLGKLARKG